MEVADNFVGQQRGAAAYCLPSCAQSTTLISPELCEGFVITV